MKKITLLTFLLLSYLGFAQITETGAPLGQTITTGTTVTSIASVDVSGVIGTNFAITSVEIDINHTWTGDVVLTLEAPSGATLDLSSNNGGSANDYTNTVFEDGSPSINTGTAPFTGSFQPEGGTFAAAFAGEDINGDWSLIINDTAGGDDGILNNYIINIDSTITQVICPADITVDSDPGACGATVSWPNLFAADDMGNTITEVQTMGPASGSVFAVGPTMVEYSATDTGGTTVTCSFMVTVNEVSMPVLVCQDITVELDAMGMASITAADLVTNGSFEPTPLAPVAAAGLPSSIPAAGTGGSACTDPTISTVTVTEMGLIGTDFDVDNVEINLTHTWNSDLEITLISPSGTSLDLSSDNGGSGDNYTNTVFQDGAPSITTGGSPFTGTFQAEGGTFASTFAGEEVNGDWTLSICDDAGGDTGTLLDFSLTLATNALVVTTGCDVTSDIVLSVMDFDCADLGANTVTITATDMFGNMTTCSPTVTITPILDTQGPVDIFTGTGTGDGSCATTVNYDPVTSSVTGCTTVLDIQQTGGIGSGGSFPVGVTTEEFTIFDDNGNNIGSYSFNVTITDTTAPVFDCPDSLAVSPDASGSYTIEDFSAGSTDNCTAEVDLVITQDPAPGTVVADGSVTPVTVTVTDTAGNVTTCSFDLTVDATLGLNDFALNSSISMYPNPTDGQITLRNAGVAPLTTVVISDINGRIVSTIDVSEMNGERQISLDNLAAGVYFARISTDNASTVKRIIKK
ncbi:MAG: subtilisin-like proprotein convertase family protein [Flavobacteriales bacterium]|jgi:subtilisin-like proprotein convertase family protein